jgi:hypothetical protein
MSTVFDPASMEKALAGAAVFAEIIKQIPAMKAAITGLTAENNALKAKIAENEKNVSSAELTAAQEKIANLTAELDASKLDLSQQRATIIALTEKFDALKALFESPVNIQDTIKVVPAPTAQVAPASPKPVVAASSKPIAPASPKSVAAAPICWGDSTPASPKRVEKVLEAPVSSNMEKSSETPAAGKLKFAEAAAKKTDAAGFTRVVSRGIQRAEKLAAVPKKQTHILCAEFVLSGACSYKSDTGNECVYVHNKAERLIIKKDSKAWCQHSNKSSGCLHHLRTNEQCCFMHGSMEVEVALIIELARIVGNEQVITQQHYNQYHNLVYLLN